jgi:phospholipid/cholesterol/gamma-HCH transport system ATP-binding protein
MNALIECRGLKKSFGRKKVLVGVDLTIAAGETLVILGGSGSGKSVLLRHMNALLRPDEGTVWLDGEEISAIAEEDLPNHRRKIGMLFQMAALFDSMTIFENVAFPMRERGGRSEDEIRERVSTLLGVVDLGGTEERLPAELSGGMRKRAGLARALALEPRAMLYDEPTTGLDPVVGHKINVLIRDLQRRFGLTGVVVTHDLKSASLVGDRIAFLADGRICFTGTFEQARVTDDQRLREFLEAGGPL